MAEEDEKLNQLNKRIDRLETQVYNVDDNKARWISQLAELKIERDILCKKIPLEAYYIENHERSTSYHQVIRIEDDEKLNCSYIVSNKIDISNKNSSQIFYSIFFGARAETTLFFSKNTPCTREDFLNVVFQMMDRLKELNMVMR